MWEKRVWIFGRERSVANKIAWVYIVASLLTKKMEGAWAEMKRNISLANRVNKTDEEVATFHAELKEALYSAVTRCRVERKRKRAEAPESDLGDESMLRAARFTDNLPLADYGRILNLVPRLVNVVTCALSRRDERQRDGRQQQQRACLYHKRQKQL